MICIINGETKIARFINLKSPILVSKLGQFIKRGIAIYLFNNDFGKMIDKCSNWIIIFIAKCYRLL